MIYIFNNLQTEEDHEESYLGQKMATVLEVIFALSYLNFN